MPTLDPRIDTYIAQSAPFAQPILHHLRAIVHEACPEVVEAIKWGFPVYEYKGMLCHMASFKKHCAFGFWKAPLMEAVLILPGGVKGTSMGSLGKLATVSDIPTKEKMTELIHYAMSLNDRGIKVAPNKPPKKEELPVPEAFRQALDSHLEVAEIFDHTFAPSHRKEYIEWINEAKTEATREKRIATAIEWISEGKQRNWKYQK
jgi:uncharacterized protein YdeI (YjbR/CyaY-like superfamily)